MHLASANARLGWLSGVLRAVGQKSGRACLRIAYLEPVRWQPASRRPGASAGQVAAGTQRQGSSAATRLQGLLALRAFLLGPHPPGAGGGRSWTAAVLAALVPSAADHLHSLLSASTPLPPEDVQVLAVSQRTRQLRITCLGIVK